MKSVLLYLEDSVYERVKKYAKDKDVSIVEAIGRILSDYFDDVDCKKKKVQVSK